MKIRIEADKEKAKSLTAMAKTTLERLNETDTRKYPSNTLVDYYEIIRKLMEAITYLEGVKIKGEGAHIQIIDHVSKRLKLQESKRELIQELREYRNRISYEGFNIRTEYIKQNEERIKLIIKELISTTEAELNKE
ncbi:hypothetical protein HZB03_00360 [Candidatus Woesearchaeota archaeon]|nr:hypothetical protein [Candidatus Woesearchaeota archaeon]